VSDAPDPIVFSALLDRRAYLPGLWNLLKEEEARSYWIPALKLNSRHMLDTFMQSAPDTLRTSCDEAHERFCRYLDEFASRLDPEGPRTVNDLVEARQEIFTECGIPDPYERLKQADNERALGLLAQYPEPLPEDVTGTHRLRWIVSLVMAGNLLDMGSIEARRLHARAKVSVLDRMSEVARKRWFKDDLASLQRHLEEGPRRSGDVVLCIDNAGAEIVLGVTSLARYLDSLGFRSVIAANEVPALNDMTARETTALLQRTAGVSPDIRSLMEAGRLSVISSGSRTSGLDMLKVSQEFDRVASQGELLIVLGQGRAIETNWRTRLSVPWARIATVKDPSVAAAIGCRVFDAIVTFQKGSDGP